MRALAMRLTTSSRCALLALMMCASLAAAAAVLEVDAPLAPLLNATKASGAKTHPISEGPNVVGGGGAASAAAAAVSAGRPLRNLGPSRRTNVAATLPRSTEYGLHVAQMNADARRRGAGGVTTSTTTSTTGGMTEGGARGKYARLAAYYHAQRRSIASFAARNDLSPMGRCKREIAALCTPSDMSQSFKHAMRASASRPGSSSNATATATTRRRSLATRALLAEETTKAQDEATAEAEDKKRIADLEAKVNALAASTSLAARPSPRFRSTLNSECFTLCHETLNPKL